MTLPQLTHSRWWWCSVRSSASSKRVNSSLAVTLRTRPGGVQVGQVPVGGAARQAGEALGDVFDAHGVACADEQVDDGPPPGGVALVDPAQAALDHAVECRRASAGLA